MTPNELATYVAAWKHEAQGTLKVLRALPEDQYEFRPDPQGWTLGGLAWHLAELDEMVSWSVANGAFDFSKKPARPKTVAELAPAYERVHAAAVARLEPLGPAQLERAFPSPAGGTVSVREVLWNWHLHHVIHHRGQLVLMCRLAGGTPPGLFGPTREQMEARRAKA